ncbi:MAG: acyl carrier protein [Syntrophobacteraceae bacterium]
MERAVMTTCRVPLHSNIEDLIEELKIRIISLFNLPDLAPADIPIDVEFIGGVLDIDSIDVLELIILLRKDYGVAIKNKEQGKMVFASLRSLAAFILENSPRFAN